MGDCELLAELRADRAAWSRVAYREAYNAGGESYDAHEAARAGVLECLRADLCPEDEDLARHLLAEEVAACEGDSGWGVPDSLEVAVCLLAAFRRHGDLGLVWRAKGVNFDTFCGIDGEYLYLLGAEEAARSGDGVAYGLDADSLEGLHNYVADGPAPTREELEPWWEGRRPRWRGSV